MKKSIIQKSSRVIFIRLGLISATTLMAAVWLYFQAQANNSMT